MMDRLVQLRQQQLGQFEEMTKLEVRILCRILPKAINDLDQFNPPHRLSHENKDDPSVYALIKQHQKLIRDYKRQLLIQQFERYESTIEQYEFLYQETLFNLESQLSTTNDQDLMISIYNYLHCRTINQQRSIRFNETLFRYRLLHPRHRRSTTTKNSNSISIYPEAIIDIFEQVFNKKELDLLSSLGQVEEYHLFYTEIDLRSF